MQLPRLVDAQILFVQFSTNSMNNTMNDEGQAARINRAFGATITGYLHREWKDAFTPVLAR